MPIPSERALVPADRSEAARRGWRTRRRRGAQHGNMNALVHGVYAEVAVREDVRDECALLYGRAPWLDEVRDGVLVEATARLIVRLRKLDAAVEADPTSTTLTSMLSRLEGQLLRNLDALGLTPTAAARLGIAELSARQRAQKLATDALDAYRPTPEEPKP